MQNLGTWCGKSGEKYRKTRKFGGFLQNSDPQPHRSVVVDFSAVGSVEKSAVVVHRSLWSFHVLFACPQTCGILVHKDLTNESCKKTDIFEKNRYFYENLAVYTKSDHRVCGNRVVIHTVFHNLWINIRIIHREPRNHVDDRWKIT